MSGLQAENNAHSTAFPCHDTCVGDMCMIDKHGGLTKREFFAALALQGILASDTSHADFPVSAVGRALEVAETLLEKLTEKWGPLEDAEVQS